jgi:hypothetical protein
MIARTVLINQFVLFPSLTVNESLCDFSVCVMQFKPVDVVLEVAEAVETRIRFCVHVT